MSDKNDIMLRLNKLEQPKKHARVYKKSTNDVSKQRQSTAKSWQIRLHQTLRQTHQQHIKKQNKKDNTHIKRQLARHNQSREEMSPWHDGCVGTIGGAGKRHSWGKKDTLDKALGSNNMSSFNAAYYSTPVAGPPIFEVWDLPAMWQTSPLPLLSPSKFHPNPSRRRSWQCKKPFPIAFALWRHRHTAAWFNASDTGPSEHRHTISPVSLCFLSFCCLPPPYILSPLLPFIWPQLCFRW